MDFNDLPKTKRKLKYLDLWFVNSLPWPFNGQYKSMAQKYIFIAILCIKMSRVNEALVSEIFASPIKNVVAMGPRVNNTNETISIKGWY